MFPPAQHANPMPPNHAPAIRQVMQTNRADLAKYRLLLRERSPRCEQAREYAKILQQHNKKFAFRVLQVNEEAPTVQISSSAPPKRLILPTLVICDYVDDVMRQQLQAEDPVKGKDIHMQAVGEARHMVFPGKSCMEKLQEMVESFMTASKSTLPVKMKQSQLNHKRMMQQGGGTAVPQQGIIQPTEVGSNPRNLHDLEAQIKAEEEEERRFELAQQRKFNIPNPSEVSTDEIKPGSVAHVMQQSQPPPSQAPVQQHPMPQAIQPPRSQTMRPPQNPRAPGSTVLRKPTRQKLPGKTTRNLMSGFEWTAPPPVNQDYDSDDSLPQRPQAKTRTYDADSDHNAASDYDDSDGDSDVTYDDL